ncbi:unnamed protein product [Coregonus sp. 'balchen']|nr:unnamed protein product [Coregonus sp. 'balchen']
MIQQVELSNSTLPQQHRITASVEIEKTREPLYQLFHYGDVELVNKDAAVLFAFHSAASAPKGLYHRVKKGVVSTPAVLSCKCASCVPALSSCAWAEKGADEMGPDGVVVHSDAFPPEAPVDTLGAVNTFNTSHGKTCLKASGHGLHI